MKYGVVTDVAGSDFGIQQRRYRFRSERPWGNTGVNNPETAETFGEALLIGERCLRTQPVQASIFDVSEDCMPAQAWGKGVRVIGGKLARLHFTKTRRLVTKGENHAVEPLQNKMDRKGSPGGGERHLLGNGMEGKVNNGKKASVSLEGYQGGSVPFPCKSERARGPQVGKENLWGPAWERQRPTFKKQTQGRGVPSF